MKAHFFSLTIITVLISQSLAQTKPETRATPMKRISTGLPAFASSGNANAGNDADYNNAWRSSGTISSGNPAWWAIDLSSVPETQRNKILVAWYNTSNYNYDASLFGDKTYNLPGNYTLEGHKSGGKTPPEKSWVVLQKVSDNTYHSRQTSLNFVGYNWLRLKVSKVNGSNGNMDVSLNLDVHDASNGANDSWLFLGDSITAFAMQTDGGTNFGQLIHAAQPDFTPAFEAGGVGGTKAKNALLEIDRWLSTFPGKYVCLSYGTNDVNSNPGNVDVVIYQLSQLIEKIQALGKIACVPRMIWSSASGLQTTGLALNARLDGLYSRYPNVVKGPDLWTVFKDRKELFRDELHPNTDGIRVYREAWAKTMLETVYPK